MQDGVYNLRHRKLTYSFEDIKLSYLSKGYEIIDDKYTSYNDKLNCKDGDGYLYHCSPRALIGKNRTPYFVHTSNPHTITNIKHYLLINNLNFILISESYQKNKKLIFKCQECGDIFETFFDKIKRNNVCSYCANTKLTNINSFGFCHPDLINEWHPTLNKDITPFSVRKCSTKKIWWICKKNKSHIWQMSLDRRNSGNGCPFCSKKRICDTNNLLYLHKSLCEEWDYERNTISPNKIFPNSNKKFWWVCTMNKNHRWEASPNSRASGKGCPFCNTSTGENVIKNFLEKHNIIYCVQKIFEDCKYKKKLRFDFYLKSLNACIEYNGIQHYEPIDFAGKGREWAEEQFNATKVKDNIKFNYCKSNGIKFLEISYLDFDNIDKILYEFLMSCGYKGDV